MPGNKNKNKQKKKGVGGRERGGEQGKENKDVSGGIVAAVLGAIWTIL